MGQPSKTADPAHNRPTEARFGWLGFVAIAFVLSCVWGAGPRVAGLLGSSVLVAVPAALLALAWGVPLGLVLAKTDTPGKRIALVVLVAATLMPVHVVTTGWLSALGEGGWLASLVAGDRPTRGWLIGYTGAVVLHALVATPWVSLLSIAAFRLVDSQREEQALLEGSRWQVLGRVTVPEAWPRLAAAALAVAVLAAGEIAITDLLRVRTFAEEVYTQAAAGQLAGSLGTATALLMGIAALAGAILLAIWLAFRRVRSETDRVASGWCLSIERRGLAACWLALAVGALVGLPIVSLVATAGMQNEVFEGQAERSWSGGKAVSAVVAAPWQHRRELRVSLGLAVAVATASTLAGASLAWVLRGRRLVQALVLVLVAVLLAVPGPLVGVGVIRLLNQPLDSPVWWLGELYGTWFAPWLAQLLRILPYTTLVLWPVVASTPNVLLDAARSDGAGRLARAWRIAVPLCLPGLVAAWLVAFAYSVGELSATVLVVPPGTPPLSVRLLSLLHYGVEDRVAAICLVLVLGYGAVAIALLRLLPSRRWLG